jgi:hypothetical protein
MMMRLSLVFACLLLSSCFSMSKEECDKSNWYNHGYNDGSIAKPYNENGWLPAETKACSAYGGIEQKKADYARGLELGRKEYCAPENAYSRGKTGRNFNAEFCPDEIRAQSAKRYAEGVGEYKER